MLLNACKDIGLAVNTGKTKYMKKGLHLGMILNEHIRIGSNSYEKGKSFKYLGSLVTNQNRLKAGNSCYYSVQTLLSYQLLSKNFKIKIHKTIILPVVLYCYEAWSLTLRVECRLRVFENRILTRIFGLKRDENVEWRRLHKEELHSFTVHLI